jgi:hypothetical protein
VSLAHARHTPIATSHTGFAGTVQFVLPRHSTHVHGCAVLRQNGFGAAHSPSVVQVSTGVLVGWLPGSTVLPSEG